MLKPDLAQWRWMRQRGLPRLGWPGVLALGMLAVALSFYLFTIRPMQSRLAGLQQTSAASAMLKTGVMQQAATPDEQLAVFYKFFPVEKKSPEWLGRLAAVAEKNGLALNDGEYKVMPDKVGKLSHLTITLPLEGSYPQIRKFLSSLNHEIPVIALEHIQFERKAIEDTTVRARVRLVLFLVQES
jgi:Tfp pilus assembly protein PilO